MGKLQPLIYILNFSYDVICIGGNNLETFGITEGEIYNFETDSWSLKKAKNTAVFSHSLLSDPDGGVVLLGGFDSSYGKNQLRVN